MRNRDAVQIRKNGKALADRARDSKRTMRTNAELIVFAVKRGAAEKELASQRGRN
jgi:hypothetical protein